MELKLPLGLIDDECRINFQHNQVKPIKKNFQIGHRDSDGSRATGAKNGTDMSRVGPPPI